MVEGLPAEVLAAALDQAKVARLEILEVMNATIADDGRMTLVEHLVELRSRLIKAVLAVAIGAMVDASIVTTLSK